MSINITQLENEIIAALNSYTDDVKEALEKTQDNLAKEAVKELKGTSPRRRGKYAKGWTSKKDGKKRIVHNRVYQITHLLEKGHAKRNGGRVGAIVHIAPVEKSIGEKCQRELERILK